MRNPKVSIILPVSEKSVKHLLKRAIDSVLKQNLSALELIIVDDGLMGNGRKVLKYFNDPRIRYVRTGMAGPAAKINEGIRLSKGEYLAFQLYRNFFKINHLSILVKELDNLSDEYTMVFSLAEELISGSDVILVRGVGFTPEKLLEENYISISSVLIKRRAFYKIGGFDEDYRMRKVFDWDMWRRLVLQGFKIKQIPVVTTTTYLKNDSLKKKDQSENDYILNRINEDRHDYLRSLIVL